MKKITLLISLLFTSVVIYAQTPILISEFEPNPNGSDPATASFELSGAPGQSFSGWILSVEGDITSGQTVDRATEVSGTFDSNGLLVVTIPDLENPSFTVILTASFTGSQGNVFSESLIGEVYDAIGIPDSSADEANLIGTTLGGADFTFTGDEPRLVFRDGSVGDWYAINDPDNGQVFDISATDVTPSIFNTDPTVGSDTFGAINPDTGATQPILISEFEPNPNGSDPATASFELSGAPGQSFSGWILSVEGDITSGQTVDRATEVSGTFDSNGLLVVTIPDLENPSFTVILTASFTGSQGNVFSESLIGEVYDAIGIPDSSADEANLIGTTLGGADFTFTGDEPRLVFRDGSVGDWYALNDPDGGAVFDITGTDVTPAIFNNDPTIGLDTFGTINPEVGGAVPNVIGIVATNAINLEGDSGMTPFTFIITRTGDTSGTTSVDYAVSGATDAADFGGSLPSGTISFAADETSQVLTLNITGDSDIETDENFTVTLSNPTGGESLDSATAEGTIQDDDSAVGSFTLIHDIQGSGSSVAITTEVTVEAIVIADFSSNNKLDGFFIQEEDTDADADPTTSEGIFVYCGSDNCGNFASIAIGDKVQITGTPTEFNDKSQLPITALTVISSGNTIPTATAVQLPLTSVADLEAYEGMLVTFSGNGSDLTVNEHFNYDRFGEVSLSAGGNLAGRFYQFTQLNLPDVTGFANYLDNVARSNILVDDGQTGTNPFPLINARGGNDLSPTNTLRGGDTVSSITGALDFAFGSYRIQPTEPINYAAVNSRPAVPPSVGGSLKVASLNVLNFFTTLDNGSNTTGPGGDQPRGADNTDEYQRQLDKLVTTLITLDADIIGLVELENNTAANPANDGIDPVLEALVNGINASIGSTTYDFIDAGVVGTDVIKVAFIYNTTEVSPAGNFAILDSQAFVNPRGSGANLNRAALAQTFTEISTGGSFTAVVNHFKSKGASGNPSGLDIDQNDGQGNFNDTRTKAAEALVAWVQTDPTASGDPDFMILGDLNAYAMEDPIKALNNLGYNSLVSPNGQSYSFSFNQQWGTLDYILANASLEAQLTGGAHWHINADEPDALDYDTSFNNPALYANDIYRNSDHDPLLVGFNLSDTTPSIALYINSGGGETVFEGKTFQADTYFNGGDAYSNALVPVAELHQSERTSGSKAFGYGIPVPDGEYDVSLYFTELFWGSFGGGVGSRVFDVMLEGGTVLDDYDIIAEVGAGVPVKRTFRVTVSDGELNIDLDALGLDGLDQPTLSGICVVSVGGGAVNTKPVITLNGAANITLNVGDTYIEEGATATDPEEGDLPVGSITIGGDTVDTGTPGTYVVTYNVMDSEGLAADQVTRTVSVETLDEPNFSVFINSGGGETILGGKTFVADTYFNGGNTAVNNLLAVAELHKTERTSGTKEFGYDIAVPNAEYDVTLYFTEIFWGAFGGGPGSRVFDVMLEGGTVLDDYDIIADVGAGTAVSKTFRVMVSDGQLDIDLDALGADGVDQPTLSGIAVQSIGGTINNKPVISLNGLANITLTEGDAYTEEGATANDPEDGPVAVSIGGDTVDTGTPGTYVVTYDAVDSQGLAADQVVRTVTVQADGPTDFALRINAGGPETVLGGDTFIADAFFTGGSTASNSGLAVPELHRTERSSPTKEFGYELPLVNGQYEVTLYFTEIFWGLGTRPGVGARVFDVQLEGSTVLDDFDIVADSGAGVAVSKTFTITVLDGQFDLYLESLGSDGANQPTLSGIEIVSLGGSGPSLMANINAMSLSPNPANITSVVSFEQPEQIELIQVFDLTGRLIQSFDAKKIRRGDTFEMDVYPIPAGTYIVRAESPSGLEYNKQMVIKR
ncbi:ExeM/NucH family extracellular endonuclease [Croceivirga thetidis]|uniref:ExeM/NucH family extracellular endonuclease n=1 Tax=Croceivirga thetidis TaxID=2721623 RepID=A0ABX1GSI8_9FLAO|nr:ExeM/NucH family extracellular endonuclease [Croceivirga thetidis]NKI31971.1 ExeM/NucH family extracellular endonuclease [Croceivirga thetidis]